MLDWGYSSECFQDMLLVVWYTSGLFVWKPRLATVEQPANGLYVRDCFELLERYLFLITAYFLQTFRKEANCRRRILSVCCCKLFKIQEDFKVWVRNAETWKWWRRGLLKKIKIIKTFPNNLGWRSFRVTRTWCSKGMVFYLPSPWRIKTSQRSNLLQCSVSRRNIDSQKPTYGGVKYLQFTLYRALQCQ